LQAFFTGNGKAPLKLEDGEILIEIMIPAASTRGTLGYMKFANRESIDFPIVGTAFWASPAGKAYRVAFTAVDRKPVRGKAIEDFLRGKELTDENINAACDLAGKAAGPVKTSLYSPSHKRKMMGLLLRGAAEKARTQISMK
jgi:CO/xanthine dehydrogenase FAD-binding subunit